MLRFRSLILSLCLMLVFTQAVFADTSYVVQAGDNLTKIAKRFNVTVAAIVKANNLSSANAIRIGQTLIIPDGAPSAPRGEQTYTVQRGDSLTRIAAKFKIMVKALKAANNLKSDTLQIGQTLIIPGSPVAAPAPSTTATPIAPTTILGLSEYEKLAEGTHSYSVRSISHCSQQDGFDTQLTISFVGYDQMILDSLDQDHPLTSKNYSRSGENVWEATRESSDKRLEFTIVFNVSGFTLMFKVINTTLNTTLATCSGNWSRLTD